MAASGCVCTGTSGRRFSPWPRISPAAGPCLYASRRRTADGRISRRNTRNARRPRLRGSTACYRRRWVAPPCGLLFRLNQRLGFLLLERKQGLGRIPARFVLRGNRHRTFPESGIKLGRNRAKIGDGQPRSKESSGCTNEGSGFHAGARRLESRSGHAGYSGGGARWQTGICPQCQGRPRTFGALALPKRSSVLTATACASGIVTPSDDAGAMRTVFH